MKFKMAFSTMALEGKIPPGDPMWGKFNASFQNTEMDITEIANEIYTAHPFTTWHSNNWRNSANYQLGQHIGIDFDTEDERSSLPYLAKDKFIQKYAAFIYTTPSHTPERPRARALFLLDTPIHQAKNYALAASAMLFIFGTADRQCKDSCRFFYGSRDCDFEWFDNVLPVEKVKSIIASYQASGNVTKQIHERKEIKATPEQKEVAQALEKIPPWGIDYDEWVKVLMALHQAFGDDGLSLARQWADGAPGEVDRKWKSFKHDGNGVGAVTLSTVYKMAFDRGFKVAA
jgi:hypothetical protein